MPAFEAQKKASTAPPVPPASQASSFQTSSFQTSSSKPAENTQPVESSAEAKVTLRAIGDVLIHSSIYKDAEKKDGTYDFKPIFSEVKKYISDADLAIANQESMIGGKGIGLSSYPAFNSPFEVGDAVKDMGIDLVTVANNHTLDRGEKAVLSGLQYWDKIGIPYTGAFKSPEDRDKIRVLTKNNIRFAFLAYSYGTNGIKVKKPYLINLIDLNLIKSDVAKAKKISDVVVVSLHFGTEYERFPNVRQKELVQELADMGVNIIIGHHPHVLQPPAWVKGKYGNTTFVAYSLGNFISAQEGIYQLIGGVIGIDITKKTENGKTMILMDKPAFAPTYGYYRNWHNFKVIPMEKLSDTQLNNHQKYYEEITKHMRACIPNLIIDHMN